MNENERIKKEKDGLDVFDDILRYAKLGFDSIDPDDFTRMRWYGLYQQKPNNGHFMLRIKLPGGIIDSRQLRTVAGISKDFGRGISDITTRQNFQFHWLTVEDLPEIFKRLSAVGITTQGACGDIFRNVTGCPLAGLDPREVFDATPWVNAAQDFFLNNKAFSDLPRKYKTSIAGCPLHCSQPEINDVGATAVIRNHPNGHQEPGFLVRVGGGLSARPFFAKRMNMFVPQDRLVEVIAAVTTLFRDYGNRENRKKARLKFLVDEWGIERFESEIRKLLSFNPDPAEAWPDPVRNFRDHVGIHAQKQPGLAYIGTSVLTGRVTEDQLFEAANIADQFGNGNLRTTNQQNLIFTNIATDRAEEAANELENAGFPVRTSAIRRGSISCTGNEFCNLALTETKKLLHEIINHLEENVSLDEAVRINLNGCPNSCGQHHIGDIGLQGCLVKKGDGVAVDGYDISLGGRLGANAKFVRPIWRKVEATQLKFAIENLLHSYIEQRDEEDDFSDFVDRHSDDELATMLKTQFAEPVLIG